MLCGLFCLCRISLAAQTVSRDLSTADNEINQRGKRIQSRVDTSRISFEARDRTRLWLIQMIAKQAGFRPMLNGSAAQLDERLSVKFVNLRPMAAVEKVLEGSNLSAKFASDGVTLMVRPDSTKSSTTGGTVTGTVVDSATSKPIAGVTVSVQGTSIGTITNAAGQFVLQNVPSGERIVAAKNVGYKSRTHPVQVEKDKSVVIRLVFVPTTTILSGVVTTATGLQERRKMGNDITTLNVDSIQRTAPITSVTDLLEARVPGVQVLRTSGQPGAPSRIRIRGVGSLNGNNDPIVIVDGIRVFSAQSDTLFGSQSLAKNMVRRGNQGGSGGSVPVGTPSPLDQIDPNAIDRIDVFKGPSATSMYGADAANGVIVITTKRGRPGDTRWNISANQSTTSIPGRYPDVVHAFGHFAQGGLTSECRNEIISCILDSVVRFQALNMPDLTVLGRGNRTEGSLGVSGGVSAFTYNFTGSASRNVGLTKLPNIEVERWRKFMKSNVPDWMRRPDNYTTWGYNMVVTAQPTRSTMATITTSLYNSAAQSSSLNEALGQIVSQYVDTTQLDAVPLIRKFYERNTAARMTSNTSLSVASSAIPGLPLSATMGLNTITSTDKAIQPRGTRAPEYGSKFVDVFPDTLGYFSIGRGTSSMRTLNVGTTGLSLSRFATASAGVTVTSQSVATLTNSISLIPVGANEPTVFDCYKWEGGGPCSRGDQRSLNQSTYGWYTEPRLNVKSRFFVVPGFRFDGGSASGSRAGLAAFPKLNFSWIAIDPEDNKPMYGLSLLRPRLAFGIAGVQPGPTDKLRILRDTILGMYSDGSFGSGNGVSLVSLGNTQLRPERSQEIEVGIDAEVWNNRLNLRVTQYRKMTHDALVDIDVAQSVYGVMGKIRTNVGLVKNTGTDVATNIQVMQRKSAAWSIGANFNTNSNKVIRLGPGQLPITLGGNDGVHTRIVPGYPLNSRWTPPILGFADRNSDGRIEASEILFGDSVVYVGQPQSKYVLSMNTDLTVGRFSVHAMLSYDHGLTQLNLSRQGMSEGLMNPDAPLGVQAASVAHYLHMSSYGIAQTLSTLRFQALSINYVVPTALVRRIQARSMTIALQGANLGLRTNYRGKDPNVNAYSTGNDMADTGQLPQPRMWTLRLALGY